MTLAKFVHAFADTTGDGRVTLEDFKQFCQDMQEKHEIQAEILEKEALVLHTQVVA